MKKIKTLFKRQDPKGDTKGGRLVFDELADGMEWVVAGEGLAFQKLDGTACKISDDGVFLKRRGLKNGAAVPLNFILEDTDPITGKSFGWVPVDFDSTEDQWHVEAYRIYPGKFYHGFTYELVGPMVQGNRENFNQSHHLLPHLGVATYENCPTTFDALKTWLATKNIEGIVWRHPDGRSAKIKKKDFDLPRVPVRVDNNVLALDAEHIGGHPHVWIQWKGTDLCCDIRCSCGEHSHFDGEFFHAFKCPDCEQIFEVGQNVRIYPVDSTPFNINEVD